MNFRFYIESLLKIVRSRLSASFGIYGISSIVNASIPFLLIPLLTRHMSVEDFGLVAMFNVLTAFITPIMGLSTAGAISRQYFKEEIDISLYIGNCLLILFISFSVVTTIFFSFSTSIARFSEYPEGRLWTIILVSFFGFLTNTTLIIWQVQSKTYSYGIFQIGQTIINLIFSIWLVVIMKKGWEGRVFAQMIATILFGTLGVFLLNQKKLITLRLNKEYFKHALRFGAPLIPHAIGGVLLTMSDRLLITKLIGIGDTGLYSVGYAFGSVIGIIENSFNLAFIPWLFEKLRENNPSIKTKIVRFTYLYFIVIILISTILAIIAPYIMQIFVDKKFEGSSKYVLWIALSFAFSGMYKMVVNYIFYAEKTYILAIITFLSAIFNFACTYVLINKFGAIGAAISASLTSFLFFIFTWIVSNKIFPMPWLEIFKFHRS